MKFSITTGLLLALAVPALALDKAQLDSRILKLTAKFEEMQAKPDKRIPPDVLRKAQGIVLLDRTKAGFLFAYEGGGGVAMVRDPLTQQWSPPSFLKANEASLGFQIGGQQSFVVILLMNTNATRMLTESTVNFGGEASGTAGNSSGKAEGDFTTNSQQITLVYSDSTGLYGGAAIKGGSLAADPEANIGYYGEYVTPREILFDKKVTPTQAAARLVEAINKYSQ